MEVLLKKSNSLNLIRFICAIFVLLSHLDWISGNSRDLLRSSGVYAVAVFFGISGYLLTGSMEKKGPSMDYVRNRFLRIFPGYLVALAMTSFMFAPFYTEVECKWSCSPLNQSMFSYFIKNVTTHITQQTISHTLQSSAVQVWNPPLWTLEWEIACYLILFLIAKFFKHNLKTGALTVLTLTFILRLLVYLNITPLSNKLMNMSTFAMYFFLGSIIYYHRNYLVLKKFKISILLGTLIFNFYFIHQNGFYGLKTDIFGFSFIGLSLMIGLAIPAFVFSRNDYSFGMYIYAAPIAHILLLLPGPLTSNWLEFAGSVIISTMLLAFCSWHLVEKRALAFKK